jgi:hypothetical protein
MGEWRILIIYGGPLEVNLISSYLLMMDGICQMKMWYQEKQNACECFLV